MLNSDFESQMESDGKANVAASLTGAAINDSNEVRDFVKRVGSGANYGTRVFVSATTNFYV